MFKSSNVVVTTSLSGKRDELGEFKVNRAGKRAIVFTPLFGAMPNKGMFLDGTVAEAEGIEPNKTYLVQFTNAGEDAQYGTQIRHKNLGEFSLMDLALRGGELKKAMGEPAMVDSTTGEILVRQTSEASKEAII